MIPVDFEGSNIVFTPPQDMTEEQVQSVPAFHGQIVDHSSNLDGAEVVIVAWKPDKKDLERLNEGGLVYLQVIGGLPPHNLYTQNPFEPRIIE